MESTLDQIDKDMILINDKLIVNLKIEPNFVELAGKRDKFKEGSLDETESFYEGLEIKKEKTFNQRGNDMEKTLMKSKGNGSQKNIGMCSYSRYSNNVKGNSKIKPIKLLNKINLSPLDFKRPSKNMNKFINKPSD